MSSRAFSLIIRGSLVVFAATALGLVSSAGIELHDSFLKYAMVAGAICVALELSMFPLMVQVDYLLTLRHVIAADDIVVVALLLAASIVMTREVHTAHISHRIQALTSERERAIYASVAFFWTAFLLSLTALFTNLRELGRSANNYNCSTDASITDVVTIPSKEVVLLKKPRPETPPELSDEPGALARAVVVPYV